MIETELTRFQVHDPLHGAVTCTALAPSAQAADPLPLCLFLFGGGGNAELLAQLRPLFESWWSSGLLPPLRLATPGVDPFCFYLDDPSHGLGWETFVHDRFLPHLRGGFPPPAATALVGISMGGQAALKIGFAHPHAYAAAAAVSPMIEPALEAACVKPRNRFHYPADVPQRLLGPARDGALYRRDSPVARAVEHADALRQSTLGIYIDAAGNDALNAHDGAEFLHRALWQLDIAHDYRLRDGSDHAGPDTPRRLLEAFQWAALRVAPPPPPRWSENEQAWASWLEAPHRSQPTMPLDHSSVLFPRLLRLALAEPRRRAELQDASLARRYGLLEPVASSSPKRP